MNTLLFDPLYPSIYNCTSFLATVVVPPIQLREIIIGTAYIVLGSIYEICYIPCFIAMILTPGLRRHSCYKIMICLAVVDILVVPLNAIISGVFLLLGVTFCSCPTFMYIIGCAALSLWTGSCALCSILALTRLVELICPRLHKIIFEGNRIYFWLCGAFLYMSYFFFFTNPLLFSALYAAWFFDPVVGITDRPDVEFDNKSHLANNIAAVTILLVLDVSLFIRIGRKLPITKEKMQQVTLQVALIGTLAIIAALIYIAMQYFPTPYPVIVIGQLTWQAGHGAASFVYFGMNNSIRRAVKRVFWGFWVNKKRSVVPTITR
ncbi:hypothetical protein QR680_001111 [Steinernema hermaphroditum]|uniref:Uncharacterized protein n=1 Tax=Steinernema hermaphroditum TaxID=289476 RepID=A0AA39LFG0_9BILA|nr:hypothetical protein QR680_001111 [Steinernema hermaphroditum]